ncbi:DNA polymerase IV [Mucilaginibacter ginkgonis]|uniref:DNA polymerase IV n=1 Tax=Mucilaginibacter ginkgonis TaxID=2682091 RepID=A0A6I4I0W2_9SPHI|nr:DNA polymerase IV [Mucilaginibacter ginkgonis]QQL49771.1 DNA polymerase IV [Mucilaginibacter ginkgonis]
MAEIENILPLRKIIHIDMDAFYASVEQRDNPELRGKPLVVGGSPDGRGVVAAASYEVRKFGVHSAMSAMQARKLCPHAIFVKPRFAVYKEVSRAIREIFSRYTDLIEPLSLDEAYLDVTQDKLNIGSAMDIAAAIKRSIKEELNLTASAGVSVNKFVAKIASDINKPDGLKFIGPSSVEGFMEKLPVEKFHGVGKVTAQRMKALNLHTGADLKQLTMEEMTRHFGKVGTFYYNIVRGIDNRPVQPDRETKSIGAEDTFERDLSSMEEMSPEIDKLVEKVVSRLRQYQLKGRTVTLKVKYSDFKQITRNRSFTEPIDDADIIRKASLELLENNIIDKRIRLLGVTVSNFDPLPNAKPDNEAQLKLF